MSKVHVDDLPMVKGNFYCYYQNGDGRWHLYFEQSCPYLVDVNDYAAGARTLFNQCKCALVSSNKNVPADLDNVDEKSLEKKGIKLWAIV